MTLQQGAAHTVGAAALMKVLALQLHNTAACKLATRGVEWIHSPWPLTMPTQQRTHAARIGVAHVNLDAHHRWPARCAAPQAGTLRLHRNTCLSPRLKEAAWWHICLVGTAALGHLAETGHLLVVTRLVDLRHALVGLLFDKLQAMSRGW